MAENKSSTKKTTKAVKKPAVKKTATAKKTVSKKTTTTAKKTTVKSTATQTNLKKKTENKKPLISVSKIVKNYGKTEVLRGISFDVMPGERVAIVGANGAGKTTLSEIIAKVKEPTSGKITYNVIKKIDPVTKKVTYSEAKGKSEISSEIGIQFQDSSYPDFYKVSDLVNFVIRGRNYFIFLI